MAKVERADIEMEANSHTLVRSHLGRRGVRINGDKKDPVEIENNVAINIIYWESLRG